MLVQRVEKQKIRKSDSYYPMLKDFCHRSKNLYNYANWWIRGELDESGKMIPRFTLMKMLNYSEPFQEMPCTASAQQTIALLCQNWKSFFKAIKDWKKHPEKYKAMPRPPRYLDKKGYYPVYLTYTVFRIKNDDHLLHFHKAFQDFTLYPRCASLEGFNKIQQVRFLPRRDHIMVELVYTTNVPDEEDWHDNGRHVGIDIGVNNLATVCNDFHGTPFILNGRPPKSINQYYNKENAQVKSRLKQMNDEDWSHELESLSNKRGDKMTDYMHKASTMIMDWCADNDVCMVVVGKNKGWKQNSNMGKRINQNFVQIPFARFIEMLEYKGEDRGIKVVTVEESYTSGTSFVDGEEPTKENYDKTRRIHRGMFQANDGTLINADLNGAYQILSKVVPIQWDRGCGTQPVLVDVAVEA